VISEVKHCGILTQTLWCFTQNSVVFLKNTTLFFSGPLNHREKVLWRGYEEKTELDGKERYKVIKEDSNSAL
jgi:hypothetical protein